MKNISFFFSSENSQFLEVKFSIYLNRRVFVILLKRTIKLRVRGMNIWGKYCIELIIILRLYTRKMIPGIISRTSRT